MAFCQVYGQSTDANYVQVTTKISASDSIVEINYADGLGRPFQTVMRGYTPLRNDLVTLKDYDIKGREEKLWKPVYKNADGTSGKKADIIQLASDQWGTTYAYSKNVYESSPLDRIIQVYGPGLEWYKNNKAVKTAYSTNTGTACVRYTITNTRKLTKNGNYPAKLLEVTTTTDEDGKKSVLFKDMHGNTILSRVLDGGILYDTYYVYDQYGNLRLVIPPAASDLLKDDKTYSMTTNAVIKKFCYYYEYDERGLCTKKRLPGCNPVKMRYDKAGRLVFSQDGNQSSKSQWTFFLYDKYGRLAVQGTCGSTLPDISSLSVEAVASVTGNYAGYTSNITLPNAQLLTVNYYDNYSFIDTATATEKNTLNFSTQSGYPSKVANVMGLQTGCRIYQLDNRKKYTIEAHYYDNKSRIICTRSTNHLGGYDITHTKLTLSGLPQRTLHLHKAIQEIKETYTYAYDHSGRLLSETYKIGNEKSIKLAAYKYDEWGRIAQKTIGAIETVKYNYNIRDWLTKISSNKFEECITYQKAAHGITPTKACYNGNISAVSWKTGNDNRIRGYKFSYDNLNRLIASAYGEGNNLTQNKNRYGETFQYDKMGNVEAVTRYGLQDNNVYGKIDDLTYYYNGNQVIKVDDDISGPFYNGAFHFVDGVDATTEYAYDKNGNMTKDLNKGISSIQYNLLNLPSMITKGNGYMRYDYNAIGEKLHYSREVDYDGNSGCTPSDGGGGCRYLSITEYTDYCCNVIYEGDDFFEFSTIRVMTDEGYTTFNGSTPQYHFYLKDHLGNNRVVVNASGIVEQVNHYYPYGGLMGESTNGDIQRYKYNGKELDRMNGLDWYYYGARHMDGIRFTTIDPMAEKYYDISPYVYCKDNPVKYVDPDGKKTYLYATTLPGLDPGPLNPLKKATHTFLVITNSEGEVQGYYAYGSEHMGVRGAFGGRLMRQQYDQDISVYQGNDTDHLKKKIEVLPPKGMSSEQFDQKVLDVANSFGNQDGIRYFMFPTKQTEGNCNTSTSTILIKAGVSSEQIKDIKDRIPDISTGFSETSRPWTEEEQKAAIEHENIIKEIHSKQGIGPMHP